MCVSAMGDWLRTLRITVPRNTGTDSLEDGWAERAEAGPPLAARGIVPVLAHRMFASSASRRGPASKRDTDGPSLGYSERDEAVAPRWWRAELRPVPAHDTYIVIRWTGELSLHMAPRALRHVTPHCLPRLRTRSPRKPVRRSADQPSLLTETVLVPAGVTDVEC